MDVYRPIFKKSYRNEAENYRPVNVTSIGCKLMESFVKESIILSTIQYGFRNGRSTTTQFLSHLDKCINTIVAGGVVDTIHFDFAKAFDSVPYQRLIGKLKSCDINGKILNRIKASFSSRRHYSGPYFPAFGLNTDQNNSEYIRIRSGCGKIWTRK